MKSAHAQATDSLGDVAGERAKHYVDTGVEAYNKVANRTREVSKDVDGYVRGNPWMSIGAAAGIGFLLGMILRRR